ncbi:hypothetical protein I7I50_04397 [Histoplasma capsulatum G186AR]|uniref:Uncharacterized protein n=1 Tax=Ajellomyces capsulatus TaxID=5037 RepID=A0A8H7YMK5_AJECA|nr:hypothetical protein I7I52_05305 [Histoplasma capsulatum]QSS75298.1 hypothetical protein I7I50_04397 [Histoplasma capsulatum G186AR]
MRHKWGNWLTGIIVQSWSDIEGWLCGARDTPAQVFLFYWFLTILAQICCKARASNSSNRGITMECFFHICHNPCPREMNSQNLAVAFNQRSHAMKQEAHLRHILLNHNAFPSMFGGITVNFDYYLGEVKRDKRRNFRPRDDTGQHTMASSATITAWLLSPATVQMYQLCKL